MNFTKLDSSEMKQVQGGGLTVSLLKSLEDNIGSPVIVTVLELVDRILIVLLIAFLAVVALLVLTIGSIK
jgi:hypothetical protein